jgi:hypothetical protein
VTESPETEMENQSTSEHPEASLTSITENLPYQLPEETHREAEKLLDRTHRLQNFQTKFNHHGGHSIAYATSTYLAGQQTQTPIIAEHITEALEQHCDIELKTSTLRQFTRKLTRELDLPYKPQKPQHYTDFYHPVVTDPKNDYNTSQRQLAKLLGTTELTIRRRQRDLLEELDAHSIRISIKKADIKPEELGYTGDTRQGLVNHLAKTRKDPAAEPTACTQRPVSILLGRSKTSDAENEAAHRLVRSRYQSLYSVLLESLLSLGILGA